MLAEPCRQTGPSEPPTATRTVTHPARRHRHPASWRGSTRRQNYNYVLSLLNALSLNEQRLLVLVIAEHGILVDGSRDVRALGKSRG